MHRPRFDFLIDGFNISSPAVVTCSVC